MNTIIKLIAIKPITFFIFLTLTACFHSEEASLRQDAAVSQPDAYIDAAGEQREGNIDKTDKKDSAKKTAQTSVQRVDSRWILTTVEHGTLVATESDTTIEEMDVPEWSTQAISAARFRTTSGAEYQVLVYEKDLAESFEEWRSRAEVGDAFTSEETVATRSGQLGYVYTTNDFGAVPAIHATVPSENFVYYFTTSEETFEVPQEFLEFLNEVEVE